MAASSFVWQSASPEPRSTPPAIRCCSPSSALQTKLLQLSSFISHYFCCVPSRMPLPCDLSVLSYKGSAALTWLFSHSTPPSFLQQEPFAQTLYFATVFLCLPAAMYLFSLTHRHIWAGSHTIPTPTPVLSPVLTIFQLIQHGWVKSCIFHKFSWESQGEQQGASYQMCVYSGFYTFS